LGLSEEGSLVYYLITAFFGGVVLNVMPCVLPVIGLKVMSFVQQAGQSRAHAWALNVWYSAGIVFVFLVLAGLAVTLQLGWGGQFGSDGFNITLIGIVFAMSLSLLGMWEIPIPGFVGTGAALEVTEREGPVAAFLKGILTTLLATPCTGPFMATALAWAVKQPAWVTFSVFGVLGLGMASPYLLIGAFPELVRFLPKPGAWMESFKKVMGLILLATVVWLLTFIESPLVVPTVGLMVGIAAACWWISQTPITAPLHEKAYGWVTALLVVVIAVMGSYGWLYRDVMQPRFEKKVAKFAEQRIGEQRLRIARDLRSAQSPQQLQALIGELTSQAAEGNNQGWQSFSLAKLGQLTLGEKRTVLVDFTADWCLTCKTLEKLVLKTQPVEEALTLGEVVTMEADYTKRPEPIDRTIKALGGAGVPLIAIFPAGDPYHPIVFSDGQYTKQALIEAIAQATGRKDLLKGKAQAALSAEDPVLR
jgi:thiol:disulfide interchange protein DsbD